MATRHVEGITHVIFKSRVKILLKNLQVLIIIEYDGVFPLLVPTYNEVYIYIYIFINTKILHIIILVKFISLKIILAATIMLTIAKTPQQTIQHFPEKN